MAQRTILSIGADSESKERVSIEGDRARVVFICGKRGSGKSYTMGVLLEELFEKGQGNAMIVVADPMGIFHSMALPNKDQVDELFKWRLTEKGFSTRLLVPGDPSSRYGGQQIVDILSERGVDVRPIRIQPRELSPDSWCSLFGLSINDLMGIALYRAVSDLQEKGDPFFVSDIEKSVRRDGRAQDKTKEAILNRLSIAVTWDIFASQASQDAEGMFTSDAINIIDLSVVDPGPFGLRALVLEIVTRNLFSARTKARRAEEFGLPASMPRVWLAIDEAHQFVPQSGSSLCKDMLIRWVKEGRQPGLGLIVTTQQPAAIDADLLSQCDLILAHKITSIDDIQALNRLSATYMTGELRSLVRNLSGRGEAILVDDEREMVSRVLVRPRRSKHGGGESTEKRIGSTLF